MKDEKAEINRGFTTSLEAPKPFTIGNSSEVMLSKQLRVVSQHVKKGLIVLIAQEGIGSNDQYGCNLMGNIILGFSKNIEIPQTIIFMNTGVKLLCKNSPVLKALKDMKIIGTNFIASYDCIIEHNITDDLKIGNICTSGEISEQIINATNLIRL
jgi:hypothetical protein